MDSGGEEAAELTELGDWQKEISEYAWRMGSSISSMGNVPHWATNRTS